MGRDLQDEIRHITAQLVEKYRPERIILFGSAARGNRRPIAMRIF